MIPITNGTPQAKADAQMQWIEQTLANSTADYLVVAGHYPIYSVCEHGKFLPAAFVPAPVYHCVVVYPL